MKKQTPLLRTKKTAEAYSARLKSTAKGECYLCTAPAVKDFKYWKIIINNFPYDRIADTHHMVVLKRHVLEDDLTNQEREELHQMKSGALDDDYDGIWEPLPKYKSIPSHFHLHVMTIKPE